MGWNVAIDGGELQLLNALDGGEIGMSNLIDGDIGTFNCIPLPEQTKSVTPSETAQTVTPDDGYALGEVDVAAIPGDYVGSQIERRDGDDLIVTGNLVNVPAGYYAENVGKAVPEGSATMPTTTITANPSISVDANGLISASVSASASVTPTIQTGYVVYGGGTPGTITASGSATEQLTTQAAQTITPSTADQTIASGKYLTGSQTILGDANLLAGNIAEDKSIFNVQGILPRPLEFVKHVSSETFNLSTDTTFDSWTASTTAGTIKAAANVGTFDADLVNYEYYIRWRVAIPIAQKAGQTYTALPIWDGGEYYQAIIKRPSSLANIAASNFNGNACVTWGSAALLEYYNTSSSHTYTFATSYGIYPSLTAATFSNSTSDTPTVTIKRPAIVARCNSSYFATGRKANIDSAKTTIHIECDLYRQRISQLGDSMAYHGLDYCYNTLSSAT